MTLILILSLLDRARSQADNEYSLDKTRHFLLLFSNALLEHLPASHMLHLVVDGYSYINNDMMSVDRLFELLTRDIRDFFNTSDTAKKKLVKCSVSTDPVQIRTGNSSTSTSYKETTTKDCSLSEVLRVSTAVDIVHLSRKQETLVDREVNNYEVDLDADQDLIFINDSLQSNDQSQMSNVNYVVTGSSFRDESSAGRHSLVDEISCSLLDQAGLNDSIDSGSLHDSSGQCHSLADEFSGSSRALSTGRHSLVDKLSCSLLDQAGLNDSVARSSPQESSDQRHLLADELHSLVEKPSYLDNCTSQEDLFTNPSTGEASVSKPISNIKQPRLDNLTETLNEDNADQDTEVSSIYPTGNSFVYDSTQTKEYIPRDLSFLTQSNTNDEEQVLVHEQEPVSHYTEENSEDIDTFVRSLERRVTYSNKPTGKNDKYDYVFEQSKIETKTRVKKQSRTRKLSKYGDREVDIPSQCSYYSPVDSSIRVRGLLHHRNVKKRPVVKPKQLSPLVAKLPSARELYPQKLYHLNKRNPNSLMPSSLLKPAKSSRRQKRPVFKPRLQLIGLDSDEDDFIIEDYDDEELQNKSKRRYLIQPSSDLVKRLTKIRSKIKVLLQLQSRRIQREI